MYRIILLAGNSRGAEHILQTRIRTAHVISTDTKDLPRGQIRVYFVNLMDKVSEWGVSITDRLLFTWFRESLENDGVLRNVET